VDWFVLVVIPQEFNKEEIANNIVICVDITVAIEIGIPETIVVIVQSPPRNYSLFEAAIAQEECSDTRTTTIIL